MIAATSLLVTVFPAFLQAASVEVDADLLEYYQFEENADDSTLHQNHGIIYGSSSFSKGRIGKAVEFNNESNTTFTVNKFEISFFQFCFKSPFKNLFFIL